MRISLAWSFAGLVALPSTCAQLDSNTTTTTSQTSSATSFGCPNISPGPVSTYELAEQLPASSVVDPYSIEAIRQTLALYALALDGRNFEALRKVFTTDVRANYSDPIGVLDGVQAIIDTLPPGVTSFASTQHHYGSQYIHICGRNTAVSVTYFQATHFFTPYAGVTNPVNNSQVLIDKAQYQDLWARQGDGTWKITNRNLVRMGPPTLDGTFPTQ
ncbi:uncharacterized protein HMPREF1541_03288 [Cyphellophora europaea CBS 101466]|uniref:SnoaL-like domain-containing protein n=1 Tax=Cyphellophora europaea (strain CBS 101466) TaxID=1220924 RepID=W2RZY5_CYPE1|nr:uncharacterized protein HMPREF1541_03288 [Cyphellophora europaea CBS 101466]ETN41353.1 hypothetical protein HMPREF1541_03288 [Cyphellophora europaea CBS 101466]